MIENPEKILKKNEESLFEGSLIDNMQRNMQSLRPSGSVGSSSYSSSAASSRQVLNQNRINNQNKIPPKFVARQQMRQEREDE